MAVRRLAKNVEDSRPRSRGSSRKLNVSTPVKGIHSTNGNREDDLEQDERDSQLEHYLGKVRKNSEELDHKLESLKKKQQQQSKTDESESRVSRMKKAMMQRRLLLKSKTC